MSTSDGGNYELNRRFATNRRFASLVAHLEQILTSKDYTIGDVHEALALVESRLRSDQLRNYWRKK